MSVQRIIQEAVNRNPLSMKEALEEELRDRVRLVLEAKMEEETELDEALSPEEKKKAKEAKMEEEIGHINELKRSTLASYVKKAAGVAHRNTLPNAMRDRATAAAIGDKEWYKQSGRNADNRSKGIQRAADRLAKEETKLDEAVTVKKKDYSWGKMITVHHGSSHSFPLHPEHQEKIRKLGDGEKVLFKDEINSIITAHREGDKIHLKHPGSNRKTTISRNHFIE